MASGVIPAAERGLRGLGRPSVGAPAIRGTMETLGSDVARLEQREFSYEQRPRSDGCSLGFTGTERVEVAVAEVED